MTFTHQARTALAALGVCLLGACAVLPPATTRPRAATPTERPADPGTPATERTKVSSPTPLRAAVGTVTPAPLAKATASVPNRTTPVVTAPTAAATTGTSSGSATERTDLPGVWVYPASVVHGTPGASTADATATARSLQGGAGASTPSRYEPLPMKDDPQLAGVMREALGGDVDRYGVVVKRLIDGRGAMLAPTRSYYAASLFKLEVLYELFWQRQTGQVRFDESLEVTPRHVEYDLETLHWQVGAFVPIPDLARAMITYSDNAAAIMLADRLGGWNINLHLQALGFGRTEYTTELPTTAGDMAALVEMIGRGRAVSVDASREMLRLMADQQVRDRIPAGLPAGTLVANKTGNWDNACHDVAVVYAPSGPYVIAALSDMPGCAGEVATLSRAVYNLFEQRR